MSSRDPSINITYGIMTMVYLFCVGIVNTLQIRVYQEKKIIPYQRKSKKKTPKVVKEKAEQETGATETDVVKKVKEQVTGSTDLKEKVDPTILKDGVKIASDVIKESFGNVDEIETTTTETAVVDENVLTITEIILITISIPLAFGFIIGFDCSCPPDNDHVSKIIFCLGVFIPIIYTIVSEILVLLLPDNDFLNPFLTASASKKERDTHFFNIQYRKTLCWTIVTLSFIIHFFSVAFRQTSGGGSVGII